MPNTTIDGNEPWKYIDLINECIQIVVTILLGVALARYKVLDSKAFVPQAVKFVFRVCLPLTVVRGLGIAIDLYDPKFSWKYICAFLVLRAFALVLCIGWIILTSLWGKQKHGIGQVAVYWLSLTWISTIILGVPISKAVFGSTALGQFYGISAAISSFIFQLPLQLLFLECHVLEKEYIDQRRQQESSIHPADVETPKEDTHDDGGSNHHDSSDELEMEKAPRDAPEKLAQEANLENAPLFLWLKFARRGDIWKGIAIKIFSNPVIWAILMGFFLNFSTLGPTYLKPGKPDYVPGLGWIFITCGWLGDMVSPLSLFAMGVWMQNQGKNLFQSAWYVAVMSMISKLIVVPVIMIGLAKAMNLSNEAGRAAVLIAALPISMASFSLSSTYKIGEAFLSESVALGTILMLPTVLIWVLVMDELGLFLID